MKRTFFSLCFISLIIITACSDSPPAQSPSQPAQSQLNLVLGVMPSMDYLPLAVALREGYPKKLGLQLTLHKFYSANERDAALQSKNIDGCVTDYTGAILHKAGGANVTLTSQCQAPFYIIAGKGSNVTTVADLNGKTIATSQNTVIDFIMDMALRTANLDAAAVRKIEVNKIPLRFELLRNNKIDATGLPDPFALMLQKEGYPVLATNQSLGFGITGIMFDREALHEKKQAVIYLYQAYNLGVDYLRSHPVADIHDILTTEMAFPPALLKDLTLPEYTHATLPTEQDLTLAAQWLEKRKLVAPGFDVKSLLDGSYLENH